MSERPLIKISTSLINKLFPDGEEANICPRQLKLGFIDRKYKLPDTDAQAAGKFFEYICLGAGADMGDLVTDLRNVKAGRGGGKSIDQVRIEDQARKFEEIAEKFEAQIHSQNVQLRVEKEWDHSYNEWEDQYLIKITGVIDFVSPIKATAFTSNGERQDLYFDEAVHDLKLTKDIWGTFGRGKSWAYPWTMGHTQLAIYNYITGLPGFYWVFDYKPKPEFRVYYKNLTDLEKMEMHEAIRKTAEKYIELLNDGWKAMPAYYRCQNCPVSSTDCDERVNQPDVQIF